MLCLTTAPSPASKDALRRPGQQPACQQLLRGFPEAVLLRHRGGAGETGGREYLRPGSTSLTPAGSEPTQ